MKNYTVALRKPDGSEHVWLVDDDPQSLTMLARSLILAVLDGDVSWETAEQVMDQAENVLRGEDPPAGLHRGVADPETGS